MYNFILYIYYIITVIVRKSTLIQSSSIQTLFLALLNSIVFSLLTVSTSIFLSSPVVLFRPILLFLTVNSYMVLFNILILLYFNCYYFLFLVNILNTSIRVYNHPVTIISWLHQYCFARFKYILVVFRIVVISRSFYSVFLEINATYT